MSEKNGFTMGAIGGGEPCVRCDKPGCKAIFVKNWLLTAQDLGLSNERPLAICPICLVGNLSTSDIVVHIPNPNFGKP